MGGPSDTANAATRQQQSIAATQAQTELQQTETAAQDRARAMALEQPAIDKYTALAAGDPSKALAAAMPQIAQISKGYAGAREGIMNSLPPGAARDTALAQLERDRYVSQGGLVAQQVQAAPDTLANIGSGLGAFSLNELGAGLRAGEGAASTNSNIVEQQNAAKATQLGFLGNLAGVAGKAGASAITKYSDHRLKRNLRVAPRLITPEIAEQLRLLVPYLFDYVDGQGDQWGVIAQDVKKVLPEAVSQDRMGYLQVDYGMLTVALLQSLEVMAELLQTQEV